MNCGHFPSSHTHMGTVMKALSGQEADAVCYSAVDLTAGLDDSDVSDALPFIFKVDSSKVLNTRNYLAAARSKKRGRGLTDSVSMPVCDSPKLKTWAKKLRSIRYEKMRLHCAALSRAACIGDA